MTDYLYVPVSQLLKKANIGVKKSSSLAGFDTLSVSCSQVAVKL